MNSCNFKTTTKYQLKKHLKTKKHNKTDEDKRKSQQHITNLNGEMNENKLNQYYFENAEKFNDNMQKLKISQSYYKK